MHDSGEGTVTGKESSMIWLRYTFQIISPFFVELNQKGMQEVAEIVNFPLGPQTAMLRHIKIYI